MEYSFSISNTGGLKLETKGKPSWINKKHFDTYEVDKFKGRNILIFTKDYDKEKAFKILKDCLINDAENQIELIKKNIFHIKEIERINTEVSF